MAKSNAIRTGVRDFYVAMITETQDAGGTSIAYGTPAVIGGTATVSVSLENGENNVYESDVKIHDGKRVAGATVSYESRTVSLEDELKYLHNITSQDGDYLDGPDDVAPPVAIGWADHMSDGTYKCQWYLYAHGSKGDETHETATESTTTPTDRFDFACAPSPETGKLRRRKKCATKAAMEAFFASVLPQG